MRRKINFCYEKLTSSCCFLPYVNYTLCLSFSLRSLLQFCDIVLWLINFPWEKEKECSVVIAWGSRKKNEYGFWWSKKAALCCAIVFIHLATWWKSLLNSYFLFFLLSAAPLSHSIPPSRSCSARLCWWFCCCCWCFLFKNKQKEKRERDEEKCWLNKAFYKMR